MCPQTEACFAARPGLVPPARHVPAHKYAVFIEQTEIPKYKKKKCIFYQLFMKTGICVPV